MNNNGGFEDREDWYLALKKLAASHFCSRLVADVEAWTEDWEHRKPGDVFYEEYPEYRNS